jgi:hypothetical protein
MIIVVPQHLDFPEADGEITDADEAEQDEHPYPEFDG